MEFTTSYLGMTLKNPIVASSSPLTKDVDNIKRLHASGAAAIVLPSLFEEQIEHESRQFDDYVDSREYNYAEALSYFPPTGRMEMVIDSYLAGVAAAKKAVDIPIIGSLNGTTSGGWVRYARNIEEAGADALELNLYFVPTTPDQTGQQVEKRYLDTIRAVLGEVNIPVAVKISPFLSSVPHFARTVAEAGAKAIVLFNRFYQPDFDVERLEVVPYLNLSHSAELRLPLRWTAILYGRVNIDLAVTSGVHTYIDVLKAVMAGASVTMMTSELLKNGIERIDEILMDLERWMEIHEYKSIKQMQGSMSQRHVEDPAEFERANYVKTLYSFGR